MSVLIISVTGDLHGVSIKWQMERAGIDCDLVVFPDLPDKAAVSWRISQSCHPSMRWRSELIPTRCSKYSAVWNRRSIGTSVPAGVHHADRDHIARHNRLAASWIKRELLKNVLAINSFEGQSRAISKIEQLSVASENDLTIPDTLFSNDYDEIRQFQSQYQRLAAKPILPIYCQNGDTLFRTLTVEMPDIETFDRRSISYMPYIFQPLLAKKSDVRLFVLGNNIFAVEIMSQSLAETSIDFRAKLAKHLEHRRIDVPLEIRHKINRFMDEIGILFGQFDFIITPDGDWVFIEVNEQGNWLWLEDKVPELYLTDCLVKYLCHGDKNYTYQETAKPDFRFSTFKEKVDFGEYMEKSFQVHNSYDVFEKTYE